MTGVRRAVAQLLCSPATFFEERPPAQTLPMAAGLVVVLVFCLTGALVIVESMLADTMDATVTMDNPDRPPDRMCDQFDEMSDSMALESCAEPATIERDAGELVQEAVGQYRWIGPVVPVALWVLGTVSLFAAGRLAAGRPSGRGMLAVAGWAALPELVRLAVGLCAMAVALSDVTITNPERAPAVIASAFAPIEPVILIASVLTVAWQWTLLTGGLAADADLRWSTAAIAVAVPLGFLSLGTLL